MKNNKFMALVGFIVIISTLLAACAPTEVVKTVVVTQMVAGTPQEITKQVVITATPVPTVAPTAAPTKAPAKAVDTAVLVLQQEPDTLHPGIGSMMAKTIVLSGPIFVGCLTQNEKSDWVATGCETVPTIDNGGAKFVGEGADKHLEVTFKIKKGWRWTDGTPVTAADAIYQWTLIMNPKFEVADRTFSEKVFSVTGKDDTFTYAFMSENQAKAAAAGTLKSDQVDFAGFKQDYIDNNYAEQSGPVVDTLYFTAGGWWPAHILSKIKPEDQAKSDFAKKPVGDGPYVLKEWKQGQEIDLVKSDKPFPLGDPKITNVIFRIIGETAAVKAALQKGEIDAVTGTGGLAVSDAPDLDKITAAGVYKVIYQPGYQWEHIDLNTTKFPFDDVKVRQALYHATDRQTLLDKLYYGKQSLTNLPVPPYNWSYSDDISKYAFDVAKSKALLAEAGWDCKTSPCTKKDKDGKTLTLQFTLMTTDRADRQAVAQVLQQQYKAVGFGVNLQFLYGRGLFATATAGGPLSARTFDAAIYTWLTGDNPDFGGLYTCSGVPNKDNGFAGQNYPGWCNKTADDAQNKQASDFNFSLSFDKRKPLLAAWYKEWTKDVPVIPLFSNTAVYVVRTGWVNFKAGPTSTAPDAWNIWEWQLSK